MTLEVSQLLKVNTSFMREENADALVAPRVAWFLSGCETVGVLDSE